MRTGYAVLSADSRACSGERLLICGHAARAQGRLGVSGACLIAASLALAACASGVRKPDLTLPAQFEAPPGSVALAPAALERWWLIFGDDELNTLEDQALALSPDVKSQSARLKEAIATR